MSTHIIRPNHMLRKKFLNHRGLVHKLVAQTAMEMAGTFHDIMCKTEPNFYKEWPKDKIYVAKKWPMFVAEARKQLASMLNGPYPEDMKQQIHQALIFDANQHKPPRKLIEIA